jgi:hypothetical protein
MGILGSGFHTQIAMGSYPSGGRPLDWLRASGRLLSSHLSHFSRRLAMADRRAGNG